jgi:ankyrin repeat protein
MTRVSTDRADRSPTHYEALEGRTDDLRNSLDGGADPNERDNNHFTPLHFAAQGLHPTAVTLLIERGAEVDAQNKFGTTAIGVALAQARDDDHGVVGLLLDAGADIDIKTNAGSSPREFAQMVANWDLKKYLRIEE